MMTMPRPSSIIGFATYKGRYVCRDPYCVKMIELRNDLITRIIKNMPGNMPHCDFCREHLNHP